MYRPTVRYNDIFRDYVDQLFQSTSLDRNQIFRLAMFAAVQSETFRLILDRYKLKDVPLPHPKWGANDHGYWLEISPGQGEGEGKDVNDEPELQRTAETKTITGANKYGQNRKDFQQHRRFEQVKRSGGEIHPTIRFSNQNGIQFKVD